MTNAGTPAEHSPPWRWQVGAGPETGRPSLPIGHGHVAQQTT